MVDSFSCLFGRLLIVGCVAVREFFRQLAPVKAETTEHDL